MNAFHMVIWIVAIVAFASVIEKYLKARAADGRKAADLDEGVKKQMEALEERIRVLERIVTESRVDLRKQIDDL